VFEIMPFGEYRAIDRTVFSDCRRILSEGDNDVRRARHA
jgi:hypothetical protein